MDSTTLIPFIKYALAEDLGDGDHTSLSTIPAGTQGKAKLIAKENGILAGVAVALEIFRQVDSTLQVEVFINDGQPITYGDIVLHVTGSTHAILVAERLVLNCMQRMSGIATKTNQIVGLIGGCKAKVLDTRKTTPGMRQLEKEAVKIGGGVNHRIGLYDMILIKDNHVDYAGGIANAIEAANAYLTREQKQLNIEIEVRNLDELQQALSVGKIQRIMLDNFSIPDMEQAVSLVAGRFSLEASGGITEQNILEYAKTGVDFISMGALTHSVKSLDLSLKAC